MINNLLDASIKTMIGQLPAIMNYNNDMIEQEFDVIYDASTKKVKLDVDTDHVKAVTGSFTNLIVNNVQIDGSTLEHYKVLSNKIDELTKNSTVNEQLYGTSYVNTVKEDNTSINEVDFSLFFDETDYRKSIIHNVTLNDLYRLHIYRTVEGVKVPLTLSTELVNNKIEFIIHYDHMLNVWNSIERIMVRITNGSDNNSIIALTGPVTKKFKVMN